MDEEQIVKFVEAYLKKKGFKQAELAFQDEVQNSSQSEDSPARYHHEYSNLRSWAYSSLDMYKHELLRVLYPVFIHSYMDLVAKAHIQEARSFFNTFREDHEMMHLRDLQKLEGVLSPSHLEEMEFAHYLRQCKVNIKICQYSNELLMQYLRKTKSTVMLGIVNEHINIQVSPGQPSSISDDAEAITLIGNSQDAANLINKKEIHWGVNIRNHYAAQESLSFMWNFGRSSLSPLDLTNPLIVSFKMNEDFNS